MLQAISEATPLTEVSRDGPINPNLAFALRGYEAARSARQAVLDNTYLTYRVSVGVAGLFLAEDGRLPIVATSNVKLWRSGEREGGMRTCAEEFLFEEAGYTPGRLAGIAIASDADADQIAGISDGLRTPTLHSCEPCRQDLEGLAAEGCIPSSLPIVTLNLDGRYEAHTAAGMLHAYGNGGPDTETSGILDAGLIGWEQRALAYAESLPTELAAAPLQQTAHFIITGQV